jgi:hypothetical protein
MAATSSVERAWLGCFREEIRGLERSVIKDPGNANSQPDELVAFLKPRKDAPFSTGKPL